MTLKLKPAELSCAFRYAEIIKKLLKPGASCLVEVFEYDVSIFDGKIKI